MRKENRKNVKSTFFVLDKNKVEGSRTDNVIQHGHHILTSCSTHGHLE